MLVKIMNKNKNINLNGSNIFLNDIQDEMSLSGVYSDDFELVANYLSWQGFDRNSQEHIAFQEFSQESKRSIAILKNINVKSNERGNGYGSLLLDEFLEQTKDADIHLLVLDTGEDQEGDFCLQKFYERKGFEIFIKQGGFPIMIKKSEKSRLIDFNKKVLYHFTNEYFTEFSETKDIGFHFGTKSAATDRSKKISKPEYDIEFIEASSTDKLCLEIMNGKTADSPQTELYYVFLRKLKTIKPDIKEIISSLDNAEINEIIREYGDKPDSSRFLLSIEMANEVTGYSALVNGKEIGRSDTRRQAAALIKNAKKSMLKKVRLKLQNPILLNDLGQWHPYPIAMAAGFDADEMSRLNEHVGVGKGSGDAYGVVRDILISKGHDGIVYKNEVEDQGSSSFIIFDSSQVEIINETRSTHNAFSPAL